MATMHTSFLIIFCNKSNVNFYLNNNGNLLSVSLGANKSLLLQPLVTFDIYEVLRHRHVLKTENENSKSNEKTLVSFDRIVLFHQVYPHNELSCNGSMITGTFNTLRPMDVIFQTTFSNAFS